MNRALKLLETSGRMARFMARVAHASLHQQGPRDLLLRSTLDQAWMVGVKSLPLLVIISAFIGTNLALQGTPDVEARGMSTKRGGGRNKKAG